MKHFARQGRPREGIFQKYKKKIVTLGIFSQKLFHQSKEKVYLQNAKILMLENIHILRHTRGGHS